MFAQRVQTQIIRFSTQNATILNLLGTLITMVKLPAIQDLDPLEGDWLNQAQQKHLHTFFRQLSQFTHSVHIGLVWTICNTMMEFFATNQHCQVGCEVSNLEAQITRLARFCQKKKLFMEVFVFCELPLYQIL